MKIYINAIFEMKLGRVIWQVESKVNEQSEPRKDENTCLSTALTHVGVSAENQKLIMEHVQKDFLGHDALYDTRLLDEYHLPLDDDTPHRFLVPEIQEVE